MADLKRHIAAAGVIAAALVVARLTRYEIAEDSMQPTLSPGDWVLGLRHPQRLATGDIVVLELPGQPGFDIVKRIAAMAGDEHDTPDGPRPVADDEVWVLGDDPAAGSVDSRHFGPVSRTSIKAKLMWRYQPLPLTRMGPLSN